MIFIVEIYDLIILFYFIFTYLLISYLFIKSYGCYTFKFIIQNLGVKMPIGCWWKVQCKWRSQPCYYYYWVRGCSCQQWEGTAKSCGQSTSFYSYWCVWLWLSVLQEGCLHWFMWNWVGSWCHYCGIWC